MNSKNFSEEIVVAGGELVEFVKRVVREGNVRRLIFKNAEDKEMLEVPLTAGAVVGGALVLMAPVLAALGALAALLAQVKVVIEREEDPAEGAGGDAPRN